MVAAAQISDGSPHVANVINLDRSCGDFGIAGMYLGDLR